MRIAIATDWFAPRRGGIEAQLIQLAERLGARGHEVDVLTATPGASDGHGFRVRKLDALRVPGLDLVVSPRLPRIIRHELTRGYDLVHAHVSVVSPVGYCAAAVARSLGLPTVVTFHSVLRHKRLALRAVDAFAGLSRSAVVWTAVSELVGHQLRGALGDADVRVLPNGLDVGFWRPGPSTLTASERVVTLVTATRLHRKKRSLELLRAFARACHMARVPARLVIVGDGPLRGAIEREVASLGLNRGHARAEIRDWLSASDLRSVYAGAEGFVLASVRESFGLAALEARAAGLPVIAMSASGSSEFLEHDTNALLCADDDDLVRTLARFITDAPLRARLSLGSTPIDRYDWARVVTLHETVYESAVRGGTTFAARPVAASV